jgi:hypothetical protein
MFPTTQRIHVSPFGSNSINSSLVEYPIQFTPVEYSDEFFETMVTNVYNCVFIDLFFTNDR